MLPDRVATRTTGRSILNEIAALARREYAQTESEQFIIPDDVVFVPPIGRMDTTDILADRWPDHDVRLSDLKPRFVCRGPVEETGLSLEQAAGLGSFGFTQFCNEELYGYQCDKERGEQ